MTAHSAPSFAQHLESLRWDHRIILLRTEDAAPPPDWSATRAAQSAAFEDLQLAVFAVGEDTARPLHPEESDVTYPLGDGFGDLRNAPPGSSVLIGFDGGIKERQDAPIAWADYYAAIEQMPMRRAEVRRRED